MGQSCLIVGVVVKARPGFTAEEEHHTAAEYPRSYSQFKALRYLTYLNEYGTELKERTKTLVESQRTHAIESITGFTLLVTSLATRTCISSNFAHHMARFTLVRYLATR